MSSREQLKGKVAIITGATSGIGWDVAIKYAALGVRVVAAGQNEVKGNELVQLITSKGGTAIFVRTNVASSTDLRNLFETAKKVYGSLDILCNNAGVMFTDNEDWKLMIIININGVVEATQLAIEEFRKSKKGGVIINNASVAGLVHNPMHPVYAATKSAVISYTDSLRGLFKSQKIRVVAICPSFTKTPLIKIPHDQLESAGFRFMSPDFVAEAFVDLAADDSKGGGAILAMAEEFGRKFVTPKIPYKSLSAKL